MEAGAARHGSSGGGGNNGGSGGGGAGDSARVAPAVSAPTTASASSCLPMRNRTSYTGRKQQAGWGLGFELSQQQRTFQKRDAVVHLGAPSVPQRARRHLRPTRATPGESVLALKRVPWTQNVRRANTRFQHMRSAASPHRACRNVVQASAAKMGCPRTIDPFAVKPAEA